MPTYDYRCNACGKQFEQFQSMKDSPLKVCPHCGKKALERLIGTGGAIIFKGSGFYQTDYRSESYNKAKQADTGEGAKSEPAKTETKSESGKSESPKTETKAGSETTSKSAPAKGDSKPSKKKASRSA